uniref:Uncharacterized protein n=1 Tax=Anguilla anguilla TaxID=7936 RepID=A0A0E9WSX7_ANGAN
MNLKAVIKKVIIIIQLVLLHRKLLLLKGCSVAGKTLRADL